MDRSYNVASAMGHHQFLHTMPAWDLLSQRLLRLDQSKGKASGNEGYVSKLPI